MLVCAYLLWRLINPIVNRFFTLSSLRCRQGGVQVPTVTHVHQVTGQRVVLVGMMHVAERAFFKAIDSLVTRYEKSGFVVLYEGIGRMSADEEVLLCPDELKVKRHLDALFALMQELANRTGLEYQRTALPPRPSWRNTDMTMLHLVRMLARRDTSLIDHEVDLKKFNRRDFRAVLPLMLDAIARSSVLLAPALWIISRLSPKARARKAVVLDERNRIAVAGIEDALRTCAGVVSIWGAAHLPGIGAALEERGFRAVSRRWFTTYWFRDISVIEAFKAMHKNMESDRRAAVR
jgi:hypothetical protein